MGTVPLTAWLAHNKAKAALIVGVLLAVLVLVFSTFARAELLDIKVNFQPDTSTVPAGYQKDIGAAYDDTRGFGWVRQDSLTNATSTPLSIVPNSRDRTTCTSLDPRLRTFQHMQFPPTSANATAVKTPAAWEYKLANGAYAVTVAVGDPTAGSDPESHVINVEGVNAISNFVPSGANCSATRHKTATVVANVNDGKLTIDAIGGTNTKIGYLDIKSAPAKPTGLTASPDAGQIALDWDDVTEAQGYNVYRSPNKPVSTSGTPLNGATPLTTSAFTDTTAQNGVVYYYVVKAVNSAGTASAASDQTRAMLDDASPKSIALPFKVNFQSETAPVPAGYEKDYGQNYANTRGFGWVEQDNTSIPLNLVGNGRDRNVAADQSATPPLDQRLDTLMHMQAKDVANFANVAEYGAWEVALPSGRYDVELSVGDPSPGQDATSHEVNVEGVKAIDDFAVTSTTSGAARFKSATVKNVPVNDGELTMDAVGGRNTKINYAVISESDTTPPANPTVSLATDSDSGADGDGLTNDDTPTFDGAAEAGSAVKVFTGTDLLGTATANGSGAYSLTVADDRALADGSYRISATATDAAGNSSSESDALNLEIDGNQPETTLAAGPEGAVNSNSASFSFSSEDGATFECRLDGTVEQNCASPKTYENLSDGSHTFSVAAIDAAGNTDQSPATQDFVVDTRAPGVSGVKPASGASDAAVGADVEVTFDEDVKASSVEADDVFTLVRDAASVPATVSYDAASRTATLDPDADLAPGADYTATVRSSVEDLAGNTLAADETWGFTSAADTTAPAVPTGLSPTVMLGSVALDWDDNAEGDLAGYNVYRSTSETDGYVQLNDNGPVTASNYYDADVPADTTLYYRVSAVDEVDNESDRSAASSVTTLPPPDTTAPETTITDGPSGAIASNSASFSFSSEDGATFECRLDGTVEQNCASPKTYENLSDGSHTFSVAATDGAGNTDQSPATQDFVVDTTAPAVSSVAPAEDAKAVALGAGIKAVFSEAMDASSITGGVFTLEKQGGATVTASVGYDAQSKTATLQPASRMDAGATYVATITTGAKDAAGNALAADKSWTFETVGCPARSTLECGRIEATPPVNLEFTGAEGNLTDKNGDGTGFTMVDPPSSRLTAADGTPSYPDVPGYEPGRLDVANGKLTISSNKGIMYRANGTTSTTTTETNSQINALGVGVDATDRKIRLETTLDKPGFPTAANSEQGGIWFGLNEDNYAKLVVVNGGSGAIRVQMARELGALSANSTDASISDERNTANITSVANGTPIKLVLEATAPTAGQATGTVGGTYKVGTGAEQTLQALSVPASFFEGVTISGAEKGTFAGLLDTHRRGTTSFNASFENFSVASGPADTVAPTVDAFRPEADAGNAAVETNVTATFSEAMAASTIDDSTFKLEKQGGVAVTGQVGYDEASRTATLNPNADLDAGATYTATVTTGVKDRAGNPLQAARIWTFTTAQAADTQAPGVPTGLSATAGDGQVALDWADNTEADLGGYNVYRGASASVDTSGTPLNGATPVGKTSSQYTDSTTQNGTTYHYVVTAVDANGNESNASESVSGTPRAQASCAKRSLLECAQVKETPPVSLSFSGSESGLVDNDGEGTGFTMVDPPSARLAADAPVYNSDAPGYEPGKLNVANDRLAITSTKGIMFKTPATSANTNSQINALGVGVEAAGKTTRLETTVAGPSFPTTASSEQGGIWFGLNEDNYAKLVVFNQGGGNAKIQMLRERNAVANDTTDPATDDQLDSHTGTAGISGLSTQNVKLTMVADAIAGNITGYYQIGSGAETKLGTLAVPASFFEGTQIADSSTTSAEKATFGGLFATHRNGSTPITLNYENFSVSSETPPADTIAPASPRNLLAASGDGRVDLTWDANAEGDIDGYNVYRGASDTVDASGTPLNAALLEQPSYSDSAVQNGTTYHYVVQAVDTSANKSVASVRASATPRASTGQQFAARVNFQSAAAAVPTGYLRDYGQSYGVRTDANQGSGLTYGWVSPATGQPLDLSVGGTTPGNGRDRNLNSDQRLDTLMHMQADDVSGTFNGTVQEGVWEIAVPNGTYEVVVSVGDAQTDGTAADTPRHTINVEGQNAINGFQSTGAAGTATRHRVATVMVEVNDGKLTMDATGGFNTKINYADITSIQTGPDTTPPATPASVLARAGDGEVSITWNANTEYDLDGYNVYAGTSAAGTPLNGATLLKTTFHIDRNLTNGAERSYVVEAVDKSGNKAAAQPVSATPRAGATDNRPRIISTSPADGAADVALSSGVAATLNLVTDGVDESTFTSDTVKLIKVSTGTQVPASYGTSGGNDVINLIPNEELEPNTQYRFEVTDGVRDLTGTRFLPYTSTFTTGTTSVFTPPGVTTGDVGNAAFDRIAQPGVPNKTYTSVTMGPDNRLYAGTITGEIYRFDVAADGNLSNPQIIDTIRQNNNDCNTSTISNNGCTTNRLIIGLTFEPGSTADNPKLWVTHSFYGFNNMKDWGGKLSVLSGANLGTYRDVLVNLPRSSKDHLTNSIAFKNGKIYIPVGATTAMGAYDNAWKGTERLLSAAVIEVDYGSIQGTLDVKTADGGTYNPYASGAPVKVFATGVRNAVDLVWHSNGNLYTPTNGSAGGSNAPATPSNFQDLPQCQNRSDGPYSGPAIADFDGPTTGGSGSMLINKTQDDYLFRVVRGGYYGNPNPSRCEWVLNGGNPTSGVDPGENPAYPVGTKPDRNWRGWAYDFKNNQSPNGAIEYKSNNFGGKLKGKLLVARYSQGDDIIALEPGANGSIARQNVGVPGLNKVTGSEDPLDLIEDTRNGNLYVTEGVKNPPDGSGKITLLKARNTGEVNPADVSVDKSRLVFNDVQNGSPSVAQTATVTNNGGSDLTVSGASLSGANANQFQISAGPTGSVTLTPGQTQQIGVVFNPTSVGPKGASLDIATNDADTPVAKVNLRGLGTLGTGGSNEPSLQWVLDTYEIPVNVGDPDPTDNAMPTSAILGDEIAAESLERAYAGSDVTVEPLAVFGPQDTASGTVTRVGNYASGQAASKQPIFSVANANFQSLNPTTDARYDFAPAGDAFGFYSTWPFFNNREVFSEDSLNTWETTAANRHKVRVYPLKTKDGSVVQDAYIVATEEHNSGFDYQDVVYIVRNVSPAGEPAPENQEIDAPQPKELVFSGVKGGTNIPAQSVSVKNSGRATLEISGASIGGANAGAFQLVNPGARSVPAGETATFDVRFAPGSTTVGSLSAKLTISSNDADEVNVDVGLYGLSTNGEQGGNEPTLQDVVNTLGHPVRVHDLTGNPLTFGTDSGLKGEEVRAPLFQKAGSGAVTIKPVARYSPDELLPFGYYTLPGGNTDEKVLATVDLDQEQTLNPKIQAGGSDTFDPGAEKFGIFVDSKTFNRKSYQQDGLNSGPVAHAVRVYPARNRAGDPVANTYLVTFEDASNGDYQDYAFRVTNARPATADASGSGAGVAKINFQPERADANGRPSATGNVVAVPGGYTADFGRPYDTTRGYGWVAPGTSTPVDLSAQTRDRNLNSDQRLDTLIIMQKGTTNTTLTDGAWEYALPNGRYEVSLSVGDPGFADSVHEVNVEGVKAVDNFTPAAANTFTCATVTANVSDGRLTVDATGGDQTKLNYVEIVAGGSAAPEERCPQAVSAGTVVTTDTENNDGATQADPVETSITVPAAGTVSISEGAITQARPSGFNFIGQQVDVTAPASTAANPYKVLFELEPSALPAGADLNAIQVFKNGTQIPACADSASTTANPDPCVLSRQTTAEGDIGITVLTSGFSSFNFGIAGSDGDDVVPPTVDVQLGGPQNPDGNYRGKATVTVNATDDKGVDTRSYSLNGGPFQAYSVPVEVTDPGSYTVRGRATDAAGNITTTPEKAFKVARSRSEIEVENLDVVPFSDRMAFSRIQNPEDGTQCKNNTDCTGTTPQSNPNLYVPANTVHDTATLRVKNTGTDPLGVSGLQTSGPWELVNPGLAPAAIPAGGQLDVAVKFNAQTIGTQGGVYNGTLTVLSDDADESSTRVELSGFWQSQSEGGQEPNNVEINRVFGYGTTILGPGQALNNGGRLEAVGDEILSPYWLRADTTKPVSVRQLAAYHTQGNTATFFTTNKATSTNSPSNPPASQSRLTHYGIDGQTLLPRKNDAARTPAYVEFTPTQSVFGFRIDPEYSDWTMNRTGGGIDTACLEEQQADPTVTCGHHLRTWPARDRAGKLVPNTYVVSMDYAGINYDFNDNVYLVTNIKPENPVLDPVTLAPAPGAASLKLDFDRAYAGTLADKDAEGTGFTSTQPNRLDTTPGSDSYKKDLLDLDAAAPATTMTNAGALKVTTYGTDTTGSNGAGDNTLVNGLRTTFDGTAGEFNVGARLIGPMNNLTAGSQQGGVMLGSDQDNFVKVAAVNKGGVPSIEFYAERGGSNTTTGNGTISQAAIPNPGSVQALDLFLLADPATGEIRAAYSVDGGALTTMTGKVTLTGAQTGRFFAEQSRAGIIAQSKQATPVVVSFDRFAVNAGDPSVATPAAREALYRLDVAGSGNYRDARGNDWTPDTGLFSPSTAINEGNNTDEIAGTEDDPIYRTYRGNVGNVAQAQRVLTYNLPTRGAEKVDLKLHFAERAWTAAGKRLFDIEAEGKTLRGGYDIFNAAGDRNTATTLQFNDVAVTDGSLTLAFKPSVDYAAISGIEVLCDTTCPAPDAVAPAAPSGLTATSSTGGTALNWDDNLEQDLAGYNVYRATSATGTFSKVNTGLVTGSQYDDAAAPAGSASFYKVKAVDSSGNEGAFSGTASATRPASSVRINAGGPAQTVSGTSWSACSSLTACNGYVTGGFAYSEADTVTGVPQGMNNAIFQSEWTGGATGANPVAVGAVAFKFDVPVANGTYNVRLHFAELNKTAVGTRVFDVNVEGGTKELTNFDIYKEAGGIDKAIVREFPATVTDGKATIEFYRQVENAKVSAIEILPVPPDTTAPAVPAGLTAAVSGGVALDWANNAETDLAGYNVYRSTSAGGAFNKLNGSLLTASEYQDATASGSNTYYYQVKAVDKSGNESGAATVDKALPAPAGFTTITWDRGGSDGIPASQPFSNSEGQSEVVGNKMYTFGGFDSQKACCTPTSRSYAYTPAANQWTTVAGLPHVNNGGVTHAGFTTDGTNIFMAGGYISNAGNTGQIFGTREAYRYNVAANTYTRLPDLPVERAGGQLEHLNGKLYFFGGTNLARTQDVGNLYVLDLANTAAGWVEKAAMPNPRHHLAAATIGGKVYAIGGQHAHDGNLVPQSDVHVYDPVANKWTDARDMPNAINHATASTYVMDGRIVVAGGQVNHGTSVADLTAYDPQSNTWSALTPLPVARNSGMAGAINGDIYFTTGGTAETMKGATSLSNSETPAPAITNPAPGSYDTDGNYAVSGTAFAGAAVELFEGTASRGTATANANGAWSISLTGVADGSHTYTAKATVSGKTSAASNALTIIVDKTAPAVTGRTPANSATDVAIGDNVTATFSEEMKASTLSTSTFKLTEQGGASAVSAAVTYDAVSKTATLNPGADLKAGTAYTATVTTGAQDSAGNPLAGEAGWSFSTGASTDTTPPAAPTVDLTAASDTGALNTDNLTRNNRPTFDGQAEANSTVKVFDGNTVLGTTTAGGAGGWSFTPPAALADGQRTITATATDAANNTSAASASLTVTIDTAAPDTALGASGPSGSVNTGSAEFAFTSETGAVFECRLDTGTWETGCVSPKGYTNLADGAHTFAARATDRAGNTDASPASRTWTVDATAPAVSGTAPADGATGVNMGDNVTATFSEAMNASTVSTSTFTLSEKVSGAGVAAGITYDAASKTATLNPNTDLKAGTAYTATVTTGVKDTTGNALSSARTWSFTTASSTPPASKTALLVAGSTSLNAADAAIRQQLTGMGYAVTVESASATGASSASGKSVVLVSSTVSGAKVGAKFRNVAVPVVTWEVTQFNPSYLSMTASGNQGRVSGQTGVSIVNATHPLAGGLTLGDKTVIQPGTTTQMTWGTPNNNAARIATLVGQPNRATVFGYDAGAQMPAGLTAPERRVGLYLHDTTAAKSNANGWTLFRAAVKWADNPPPEPTQQAVRINAGGAAQTVNGTSWSACSSLTACDGYVTGGSAYSEADTITGIPQNMNNTIFQSEWTGGQTSGVPAGQTAFTFDVPAANGSYNVRLHFAELNKFAPNLRLFDVNLEGGALELNDFDVYAAAGGADKAIVREFPVTVADGKATIQFITVKENAKVSAIEILPTGS